MEQALVLAALLAVAAASFEAQTCRFDRSATIQAGAEAMIGGLIGMHEQGTGGYGCGFPASSKL